MIGSNGLALDRQDRLLIATWSGRSIDRIEKDGKRTILADRSEGKRFGGTNNLVVKKDGAIYFTDDLGGPRGRDQDPKKELDFAGMFMWKDGQGHFSNQAHSHAEQPSVFAGRKKSIRNWKPEKICPPFWCAARRYASGQPDVYRFEFGSCQRHHGRNEGGH
jgi:hypothetical protein